jgi:hypothetical protein
MSCEQTPQSGRRSRNATCRAIFSGSMMSSPDSRAMYLPVQRSSARLTFADIPTLRSPYSGTMRESPLAAFLMIAAVSSSEASSAITISRFV